MVQRFYQSANDGHFYKFYVEPGEISFLGHWHGLSPIEIENWYTKDIRYWHNEAVKIHNEMNKIDG